MSAVLRGGRIVLRPWADGDAPALLHHANDREVWRNLRDRFPHPYGAAEARAWLAACHAAPPPARNLAIELAGNAVGGIGVEIHDDIDRVTGEVGYWLGRERWGQGLATEALRLFTPWAFEALALQRLEAHVLTWNPASGRVLEKAGYVREAVLPRRSLKDGEIVDNWLYARLRG